MTTPLKPAPAVGPSPYARSFWWRLFPLILMKDNLNLHVPPAPDCWEGISMESAWAHCRQDMDTVTAALAKGDLDPEQHRRVCKNQWEWCRFWEIRHDDDEACWHFGKLARQWWRHLVLAEA